MELNLQDVKDIANRRANRKSNKMTIFQAVTLTLVIISGILLCIFAIKSSVDMETIKSEKITYSIPVTGDLIYKDGIYTINGLLVKPDKEIQKNTDYWSFGCIILFMFSFVFYIFDVLGRMEKEKNRIMDYYFEHKELPKEE